MGCRTGTACPLATGCPSSSDGGPSHGREDGGVFFFDSRAWAPAGSLRPPPAWQTRGEPREVLRLGPKTGLAQDDEGGARGRASLRMTEGGARRRASEGAPASLRVPKRQLRRVAGGTGALRSTRRSVARCRGNSRAVVPDGKRAGDRARSFDSARRRASLRMTEGGARGRASEGALASFRVPKRQLRRVAGGTGALHSTRRSVARCRGNSRGRGT